MLTAADLRDARMVTRAAVHGTYRGIDILGAVRRLPPAACMSSRC